MLETLEIKPIHPKNGNRYRDAEKRMFEFRYGRWVLMGNQDEPGF